MIVDWSELNPVVSYANKLHCAPQFSFGPRKIRDHQFIFVAEGKGKAQIQDRTYRAKQGDLFYYGPDITHYFIADSNDPFVLYGIHFSFDKPVQKEWMIQPVEIINVNSYIGGEPVNDLQLGSTGNEEYTVLEYYHIGLGNISDLIAEIVGNYYIESNQIPKLNQTLFTLLLFQLSQIQPFSVKELSTTDTIMQSLKKQLDLHAEHVYTRSWLSEWTQYHADHAARLFRKKFGLSPHDYHSERKLQKAKQYLTNTELRVNEIAELLNFGSVHHFSRKFKVKTGYSPTEYRSLSQII